VTGVTLTQELELHMKWLVHPESAMAEKIGEGVNKLQWFVA
jgi:hypothetical protein